MIYYYSQYVIGMPSLWQCIFICSWPYW